MPQTKLQGASRIACPLWRRRLGKVHRSQRVGTGAR
eukprot:CAMPEP_0206144170 /NCGR_PEP_ID=MMETSP1473-20131121/23248_1 /ASSEMBLY_ACC=CAM_ASM_001109 /TAXON_ID=1461547 /ORGANISM="Stichococcus sp, Strain RCC1054" /LENGTH=35 /DNA_ID= /DNA_START= /DNA_END= /DNA_ORIENTATION=